ncbi:olfactory receptor 52J3-like [Anguilla anguilla]|uniref:olfactory receptor 52J3-like n=1 Tax=Anguilla anguilla TaxID=7936 RepID=UPI0015B29940|nr:olfactory receptor 52J3-like [Anguilla anguilla]
MEMEPNSTDLPPFFYMETLGLPPSQTYFAVVMGTVAYCFILAGNMTMILSITLNRSLHKPMYLMLLNLPINDLMGATAFFPQLISSIALEDRSISCAACFLQGLLVHLYAGGAYIILTAMAYDRFLAICNPLRYSTLMSNTNLLKIVMGMWLMDLVLILALFCLLARFRFCGNRIVDMYCNNASLVKLVCGDTSINNYYGLFLSSFLQGMSLLAVVFTYVQILVACLTNKQSDTKSKALRTCATHLTVYLVFQVTSMFTVLSHRFNQVSPYLRRSVGVSILLFPPILNPLIYGLNTKEIRSVVIHFFTKKKVTSFAR